MKDSAAAPQSLTPETLASKILDILPQTQCKRCGYADCAAYAQAIAAGHAGINQCPPGGAVGVRRIAQVTGHAPSQLNPDYGVEGPRQTAIIDENWCIGCTLCIQACPTDAIVGINKRMHTVIDAYCTGCALCIPVCPVDCIQLDNVTQNATGWDAWTQAQAGTARARYTARTERLRHEAEQHKLRQYAKAQEKLSDLALHSKHTEPTILEEKRIRLEAILAKARTKQK